jgi:hypothetical protein
MAATRVRVRGEVLQYVIGSLLAIAYDRIKVADPLPYSAVRILKAEVRGIRPAQRMRRDGHPVILPRG